MAFISNNYIEEEDYRKWVEANGKFLRRFILENFTIQKTPIHKVGPIDLPKF